MVYARRNRIFFLLFFLFSLIGPTLILETAGDTELKADRLEVTAQGTIARGNAVLTRDGLSLKSDYIELTRSQEADRIAARGNVKLESGEFSGSAEELSGVMGKGEGEDTLELILTRGRIRKGSQVFRADEVKLKLIDKELMKLTLLEGAEVAFGEDSTLTAREVSVEASKLAWWLEAKGEVSYRAEDAKLLAAELKGNIEAGKETEELRLTNLKAKKATGKFSPPGNSDGNGNIRFTGRTVSYRFDGASDLEQVEFTNGSFTRCEGCTPATKCAYSISAERTTVANGDFVLARSARFSSFGLPVWRSPLYFITLKDYGLPKRSYFPRIGFSSKGGLSFSGAAPLYLNEENFGNVRADYFTRTEGLGVGLDLYSGGDSLTGLGEFYGLYRPTGPNYLAAEASVETTVSKWLELNISLDHRNGPYRGSHYNRKEWSLSLNAAEPGSGWELTAARVEEEVSNDDSEENVTRVVERIPELSVTQREPLGFLPFTNDLNATLGFYREREKEAPSLLSKAKAGLEWTFSSKTSPVEGLRLSLSGLGGIDQYVNPETGDSRTRGRIKLLPGLELEGPGTLGLTFEHRTKTGDSPFDFDAITPRNRLNLDYQSNRDGLEQKLDFHYSFPPGDGFSDLEYEVGLAGRRLNGTLSFEYSLSDGYPKKVGTEIVYSPRDLALELSTSYDFSEKKIGETSLRFHFFGEENDLKLKLSGQPFRAWLEEVSADVSLELLDSWSFNLSGEFNLKSKDIPDLSYSVYHTLQNCLKVGLTGGESGLWFDVQLVGF